MPGDDIPTVRMLSLNAIMSKRRISNEALAIASGYSLRTICNARTGKRIQIHTRNCIREALKLKYQLVPVPVGRPRTERVKNEQLR